jgi:hypothetical protein
MQKAASVAGNTKQKINNNKPDGRNGRKKMKTASGSDGTSGPAHAHTSSEVTVSNTDSDVKPCNGATGSEELSKGTEEPKQEQQQLLVITRSLADGDSPGRRE